MVRPIPNREFPLNTKPSSPAGFPLKNHLIVGTGSPVAVQSNFMDFPTKGVSFATISMTLGIPGIKK